MLGIIFYLVFTNQPNLATTITSVLTMLNYLMSTVENWGFSLNNLQVASIKLCNLTKIYPERKDLIKMKAKNLNWKKLIKLKLKII